MSPLTRAAPLASLLALTITGCRQPAQPTPGSRSPAQPPIRFEDVTAAAGVSFKHNNGADGRFLLPESIGGGCAFLDFDGDGLLDLFFVNGTSWPDRPQRTTYPALYRNRGKRGFEDVTRKAGLAVPLQGVGCSVGDFDNDGHDDLLITCLGPNRLFRNLGNGAFRDVTAGSGLTAAQWDWHTSAAWTDFDHDGKLDLFICRYVDWSPETDQPCHSKSGQRTYCGPEFYPGKPPLLYRNLGGGRFEDVSAETGVASAPGKGLGILPIDENRDGWTDLIVANDLVPNFLFRNKSGHRFQEVGQEAGVAVGESGQARAGMGIDAADIWNDGRVSVAIGNFANEGLALFSQDGDLYEDRASTAGLLPASLARLTFGLLFLDADRDGRQDLFAYNGHVDPLVAEEDANSAYRQLPLIFRNEGARFVDASQEAGPAFQVGQVGRGCAWGDFDNDGRPDLLLCENGGPARLLRNATTDSHHWLGVKLLGAKGNRNGYGAEVTVSSGGVTQRRWIHSGGSYLTHSDTRALFGLGKAASVDRLEVKWPSGAVQRRENVAVNHYLTITEETR
ncbi:MAG: CRTAC1 family protein [Actinomycetota bacterium]